MCYCLYIATTTPQQEIRWEEGKTLFCVRGLSEEELLGIKPKMKNPFIYHLGARDGCYCDFNYLKIWSEEAQDEEDREQLGEQKKSPLMLLDFIKRLTKNAEVELFCCWHGDWDIPILESIDIDIQTIVLEENYFGMVEGRYIKFLKN